jgi:HAD superfamily hydrolase (TIGR01509 family)
MSQHAHASSRRPFRLRAVLFDFDGTLTRPGSLDFAAVKREVGCPPDRYVLEWIEALPTGAQRTAALQALERFELDGAATSHPNDGAEALVGRLRGLGLRVGVLTRNGRPAVDRALERFPSLRAADFDVVVTRDDDVRPKPAPDGVEHAAAAMGASPSETLVVGDYLLDMEAGRAAGAVTAYLTNGAPAAERAGGGASAPTGAHGPTDVDDLSLPDGDACDFVVGGLDQLDGVVRLGLPLPQGKLPNDLLAEHLRGLAAPDDAVLLPAAVGEDVTALDMAGVEVLVAHGDPITLAGRDLGRYAVAVNANDLAASGGEPRWLLTTVLLPAGATASEALTLLAGIGRAARDQSISVVGGHTEVTGTVTQPVVSSTMLGTATRPGLRDKRGARRGDLLILTKALAVEGTALLAQELGERLRALGMTPAELEACEALFARISIVPEARIAARYAGVRAMHDITEGGLATAVRELAEACGRGVTVRREAVAVSPETRRLCDLLGADPLGLLASGSLLVTCRPGEADDLLGDLRQAGIDAAVIGGLGGSGAGVTAVERGRPAPWPEFAADEAARLLAESRG